MTRRGQCNVAVVGRAERGAAGASVQHGAVRVRVHRRVHDGRRARHRRLAAALRAAHPHHRGRARPHGDYRYHTTTPPHYHTLYSSTRYTLLRDSNASPRTLTVKHMCLHWINSLRCCLRLRSRYRLPLFYHLLHWNVLNCFFSCCAQWHWHYLLWYLFWSRL